MYSRRIHNGKDALAPAEELVQPIHPDVPQERVRPTQS